MTQTWEVFRFELDFQVQRVSTRLYFAMFLGLSVLVGWAFMEDARRDGYFFNAPIITAAVTIIASMVSLLVTAGVAGDAANRDVQMRLAPLLFTTPVSKRQYLAGRFLGAFAVSALLLVAVPIALLLSTFFVDAELLGPFRAEAYLTAYCFFALPNAFISTAFLFSIAAISRSVVATYIGAAFLFFAAFLSEAFFAARLGRWGLAQLLDPLGYTTMRTFWRSWNPVQRNVRLIEFEGPFLTNRLIWLGLSLLVLTVAYMRFRFAHESGDGRSRITAEMEPQHPTRWLRTDIPHAGRSFGLVTRLRQVGAIAGRSFRELVISRAWLIVPLVAVVFVITAPELLEVELGTPGAATSARLANILGVAETTLLITILIALSAGELYWSERETRINSIADVAPVPEWVMVLGKYLSIAMMLAAVEVILLVAAIVIQAMQGSFEIDLGVYATTLFGFQLTGFLLVAALSIFVHVVVNQKYVANVVAVLIFVGNDIARELGVTHNLLLYGSGPKWEFSEMGRFGLSVGPMVWFRSYWGGWALLLSVVSYLLWVRGEERGLRRRLEAMLVRLTPASVSVGAVAIAVILGAGGFVFYNTNILNRFETDAKIELRRAEYERRYGRYATIAQPLVTGTKLQVDFYPKRSAATVRGSYRLTNHDTAPIASIHVGVHPTVETRITIDRPSRMTVRDDELGYRIYALSEPMKPGGSLVMNFEVAYAARGFTNEGRNSAVMANGSWIQHRPEQRHGPRQWLPLIGYQAARELDNAAARRELGLRPRPAIASLHDAAARQKRSGSEKVDFEAIVSTDADQVGVTTGELRRTWVANGRRYSHFVTDSPISNAYVVYSANYAVHRAAWRDVQLEIFHHPSHTANLDHLVRSARASLEYHTRHYSPYPRRQLRMIEFPSAGDGLGLTSYEGAIKFSEGYALVRPKEDPRKIDLPFAVMAHEVGHQWWGHQLVPAPVEGAPVLSESLAWYSAMLVVEETLGRDHLMRILDVMRSQYLAPHQTREVPLLRSFDRLDAYRTGPFAMFALREAVGPDRVNGALRRLLGRFDGGRPPYATSLDLYAELRKAAPASSHYLLKDLFEEITFWDLKTTKAEVQSAGRDTYRVTLHVSAQKLRGTPSGKETPVAMNDPIEVAIADADGKPLYRRVHRIRSGEQKIVVNVKSGRPPARAGVDPDHALLDREPDNNEAEVSASS